MAETELDERDLPATSIVYLTTTGPLVSSGPAAPLDVISTCREASCVAPFSLNSTPQNAAAPLHRRRCHRDHASDCFRVGPIVSSFRDRSIIDAFIWSGWLSSRSIPILWEFFSASCCGEHGQNGYSRIGPPLARIDERYYLLTSRHGSAAIRLDLKGKWRGGGGRREARLEAPCALERNVRPTRPGSGGGRSKGLETKGIEHSPPAPPSHPRGRAPTMPISHAQRSSRTSIDHEGGGRRDVVDPQVHEAEPPPTSHLPKRETDERVARIFCFPRSNATSRRPFSAPGNCDDDDERG